MKKIAPFFAGWEEALIWSCLQGCMGYALCEDECNPTAAQIVVGDFCFFAGKPDEALARRAAAPILVPKDQGWERTIEEIWKKQVEKQLRYGIKKVGDIFDSTKLREYTRLHIRFM